ncbi:hypothetical protein A8C56_14275 [Niabella ginsenosidivorans]|uniref:DUF4410 domain-containing protein n=1 Tax=Niabella ginsenosidivorans TaxID=1176587 RepID=A0A1A9I5L2_9BACT|nr:hypothetical protein [Niabella ginsenosidivorans]ANH81980.1 hypothetical protein A8C56_14275 [Niabella ginsenosidivorans]
MKGLRTVVLLITLLVIGNTIKGQQFLQQGSKIYVSSVNKQEHAGTVKDEMIRQLEEWGYWKVVRSKKEADLVLDLNVQTHRGMTAWSWGGVTVRAAASIEDPSGETLWQSREYRANPNGTNGFNTAQATVRKIVGEMQKRFGRER